MRPDDCRALLPEPEHHLLGNGLSVCLLHNRQAPVVTTALCYRTGARHDPADHAGSAHFLEHMMFKGHGHYGPGDIDSLTRRLGGSNNAFTSHDATLYYFTFAADRWQQALAIEATRMEGLTLDPSEVVRERLVILEEIAMYEDEPWDALAQEVTQTLFRDHPYGRAVLGTREALARTDEHALRAFHQRHYRPDNAVLVVAGDIGADALDAVAGTFGTVAGRSANPSEPSDPPAARPTETGRRLERRHGEVARLLIALPAPAADTAELGALRLLLTLLATGRASRLHRALVDVGQLCTWVSADLEETVEPGSLMIAAEVVPGIEPQVAEAALRDTLEALRRTPPTDEEVARARNVLLADWVIGHERIHQQALTMAGALGLFTEEHVHRPLEQALATDANTLHALARRYLDPDRGVVGWSLPA